MRPRPARPADLDPLFLRVSAKWLESGVPHDNPAMTRRARFLGLTPEAHRDAALAAARAHAAGGPNPTEET